MSEEEKPEKKTVTLKITLPTKETIVKALSTLFPGIEVEVEPEEGKEETEGEEKKQAVLLKLGPELGKDFKLVADLCFDGNYDEALRQAVVMLVKKEKLLCHSVEEKYRLPLIKVVDKFFDGNIEDAVREAVNLLLDKYQVSVSG